jgi:hypothetical protein
MTMILMMQRAKRWQPLTSDFCTAVYQAIDD